ncbi:flippase [Candidatus Woesearchaeota archaeon]|nr:flippase [Candidatus Woesearchaeota archaeon]
MSKNLNNLAEGASIIFLGIAISKLLHYIYRAIIARMLTPGDYGIIILGMSVISIFGWVALFGLNQAAERNISFYHNKKRELKGVLLSILKFGFPLALVLSLLLLMLSKDISLILKKENLIQIIKIMSFGVMGYSLAEISGSILRGFKKIREFVYVKYIIEPASRTILTIIFIILGLKIKGAAIAYILSLFISIVIAMLIIRKTAYKAIKKIKAINMDLKIIKFSWPLLFTGLVFSITGWIDTLMIAYFSTEELVGLYNTALPTAGIILITQSSFDGVFIPIMSRLFSKKDYKNIKENYERVTKWITILTIPLFMSIIFFSKGIINILFGTPYLEAYKPTIILAVGFLMVMIVGPCENMLNVTFKTKLKMYLRIIMLIINIILNLILIPRYGISGAAISTSVALTFYNICCFIYVKNKFNVNIIKLKTISIILASALLPLLLSILYNPLNKLVTMSFIILSLIYSTIIIILMKYLNKEDIIIIYDIEKKLNIKHTISSILTKYSK